MNSAKNKQQFRQTSDYSAEELTSPDHVESIGLLDLDHDPDHVADIFVSERTTVSNKGKINKKWIIISVLASLLGFLFGFAAAYVFSPTHDVTPGSENTIVDIKLEDISKILVFSDLHYNPYYNATLGPDCFCSNDLPPDISLSKDDSQKQCNLNNAHAYGQYGCDPPYTLMEKTLSFAKAVNPNPEFILILGDLVRHNWSSRLKSTNKSVAEIEKEIVQTIQDLKTLFVRFFPNSKVVVGMGNNDVFEDYDEPAHPTKYIDKIAKVWKSDLKHFSTPDNNATATFIQGGYYKVHVSPEVVILMLNTNLIATHNTKIDCTDKDPAGIFVWLRKTLKKAKEDGLKVWIAGHIPIGIDHYGFSESIKECHLKKYRKIVDPYENNHVIAGNLFGHEHRNLFRGVNEKQVIYIHSAVTPVYGNNPGFRQYEFHRKKGTIYDYSAFFLDLADKDPSYKLLFASERDEYKVDNPTDPKWMKKLVDRMEKNWTKDGLFGLFWNNSDNLGNIQKCKNFSYYCIQEEICSLRYISKTKFDNCVSKIKQV